MMSYCQYLNLGFAIQSSSAMGCNGESSNKVTTLFDRNAALTGILVTAHGSHTFSILKLNYTSHTRRIN